MAHGDSVPALARGLLASFAGARFDMEEYSHQLDRGQVGAALNFLIEQGAVSFQGEKVLNLDYPLLWQHSSFGTVMALMPLPFSLRFEGLATGLHLAFAEAGIPFRLGFMRGATMRLEALLEGRCDFSVTSKMTARLDMEQGVPLTLIHAFGFRTFVKEYVVAFRDPGAREIVSGMRIALDPVSIDQTILTSYECEGKDVEFVEAPYVQSLQKLASDQLDAVIWSLDELEERGHGFNIQPLSDRSPRRVAGEDTAAVLATSRDKADLGKILVQLVDFDKVQRIQNQVLMGKMKPSY